MSTTMPTVSNVDEKHQTMNEHGLKGESNVAVANGQQYPGSEDGKVSIQGDDALKLVGTHVHQFDEKYYRRLRRKIVSAHSGPNF